VASNFSASTANRDTRQPEEEEAEIRMGRTPEEGAAGNGAEAMNKGRM
jgi:hypothetical protein